MVNSTDTASQQSLFLKAAAIAGVFAVARFFIKGWLAPLAVPAVVGSFLASVTVVLIVAMVLLFLREGRSHGGSYWKAAAWFAALAVWCQALIIGGILLTERLSADTYYSGPWDIIHERFPTPAAHAIGHTQGMFVMIAIGLALGGIVYSAAKRGRRKAGPGE